jgi:hypothetical protein
VVVAVVVVDDVRAERLDEKSSGGAGVTTEDRPGHVRRCAQVMRKKTLAPRFYFQVEAPSFKVVFISSAEQSIWSPLKESGWLRCVWAFDGDAWSCDKPCTNQHKDAQLGSGAFSTGSGFLDKRKIQLMLFRSKLCIKVFFEVFSAGNRGILKVLYHSDAP